MTHKLNKDDAHLLDIIQQGIPLVSRPFEKIGKQLNLSEAQCLEAVRRLREEDHVIRQISAIFDTKAMGYQSALVAAKIPADQLENGAAVVSGHPGVSHNYERNHDFNLWYTIAIEPDSELGLQGTVDLLHQLSGAQSTRLLPTLKLFKIGVRFNLIGRGGSENAFTSKDQDIAAGYILSEQDIKMVRVLQDDMPLVLEPFKALAKKAACSEEQLLETTKEFLARKQMRRFSAVLHHRSAGVRGNAMGVWEVDPAQADQIGTQLAGFDTVSHCYLRPCYDDWEFNIFTMVHHKTYEGAMASLREMQQAVGVKKMEGLRSVREFKKVRVRYFDGRGKQWELEQRVLG